VKHDRGGAGDTHTTTILLVEDEAIIALEEKTELECCGDAVTHKATGEAAVMVALMEGACIDLVLRDINLGPCMNGTGAARKIIARHDIPVVFLSSQREPEIVEKTEQITSCSYVVKDSGITVLDAAIRMALRLHDANRALRASEEKFRHPVEEIGKLSPLFSDEGNPNGTKIPAAVEVSGFSTHLCHEQMITVRGSPISIISEGAMF